MIRRLENIILWMMDIIIIKIYFRLLKPFSAVVYSNDTIFSIYSIPLKIFIAYAIKVNQGYRMSYLIDIITKRKLKYRSGSCKMCGSCCEGCQALIDLNGKKICKTYRRRSGCDVFFPISKEQLVKSGLESICGYRFLDQK